MSQVKSWPSLQFILFIFYLSSSVFVDEMEIMCDIFNKAVETQQIIDLHDMMFRFTLDSFVL